MTAEAQKGKVQYLFRGELSCRLHLRVVLMVGVLEAT